MRDGESCKSVQAVRQQEVQAIVEEEVDRENEEM